MLQHFLRTVGGTAVQTSPVYQSSTTASKSTGTDLTINIPTSTVAGDLLIAVLVANQTAGWNQATGWTRLVNSVTDPSTSLQYKIADGTEGATQVFVGANIRGSGTIMRFTNAGIPYVSTVQTGTASSQTAPSVTITSNNSLVLSVFTADATSQTWTGVRTNPIVSFGTQCSFDISYDTINSGASGTDTATMSTSDTYACFQVGISLPSSTPRFIAEANNVTATNATTFTINKPTGTVEDDILIAIMTSNTTGSVTWTTPAGWTEVNDAGNGLIAYKTAGASEGASYTFTSNTSAQYRGCIVCYRDVLIDAIGTVDTSSPFTPAGVTMTDSGILVGIITRAGAAAQTLTLPASMTSRFNSGTTDKTVAVGDEAVSAGATGSRTFTSSNNNNVTSVLIGLKKV